MPVAMDCDDETEIDIDFEWPIILKHKTDGQVVFFFAEEKGKKIGVCLQESGSIHMGAPCEGEMVKETDFDDYVKFKGKITLSNED